MFGLPLADKSVDASVGSQVPSPILQQSVALGFDVFVGSFLDDTLRLLVLLERGPVGVSIARLCEEHDPRLVVSCGSSLLILPFKQLLGESERILRSSSGLALLFWHLLLKSS